MGIAIRKAKILALEMALSKSEAKKEAEDAAAEEEIKCLAEEAAGDGENQMKGHQQEMWCKIWMLSQ